MRHRKSGAKLNMSSSHRHAMFRNMVTSLLKHDRIRTTDARAKELRRWADRMITLAKRGDLHARRQALSIVREKDVVHKLFEEADKRFGKMNGGYTRITKLGRRPGDAAQVSIIELISIEEKPKKKKKKAKPAKTEASAAAKAAETSEEVTEEAAAEAAVEAETESGDDDQAQAAEAPKAVTSETAEPDAEDATEQDTEKKED